MKMWDIYTPAGDRVGQYPAFAPEVAFCEYMSMVGEKVEIGDIRHRHIYEGMEQISFGRENYVLLNISPTLAASAVSSA
jgi:hypothetical protein